MENNFERRNKLRIDCDYSVIVEGYNGNAKKFRESAKLANLSASGLYMIINRKVECGNPLSMTILLAEPTDVEEVPQILVNGAVVRIEQRGDGSYGVAVRFKNYRFR